jgi:mannose-6-phosphate isomerase
VIGTAVEPLRLSPNPVPRFYRGGEAIARFRGIALEDDHAPEDWIGSTTAAFGESPLGLSALPDGRLLRDAVEADPEAFLGPDHVVRYGADTMLLVKLLDAGERLPVHYHPDDAFARRHGFAHGKTEAWLIVEARPRASVWLGFREDADRETLRGLLDGEALLGALNELPVAAGDLIFVPAGVPHAIGDGILILELQQPSDLSVLLEWSAFGLAGGLELDPELEAIELGAFDAGARPWTEEFFRVQRVRGRDRLEPGFSIVVVLDGCGRLRDLELARGDTILVPFAAGTLELQGEIEAVRCRAPAGGE